ncbi:MAG: aspartate aminotransferase family protein [Dehalococcoidia bacterium]
MSESSAETVAYRSENSRSKQLYEQGLRVLPGANSRHSVTMDPYPIYVRSGKGCRIVDVEGEERIDFINNMTSLIHGHSHPVVMEAVRKQLEGGTAFAMPTEPELELASLLVERIDYIDKLRFCNSGSEAVMLAIKAARAFTGKTKIAKIEGAYHGSYDYAQVSESAMPEEWGAPNEPVSTAEPGVTPSTKAEVIVMPWNNAEACAAIIEKQRDDLAAVLIDPLPTALGWISPRPGFLESLRELTSNLGILLISDEVISFRVSYKGACHEYGIKPDVTALAKIIGGGFPVGAVGGSDEVMEVFDHRKGAKVHHGGTFNANPVTMTAGLATMKQMTPEAYDRLNDMGDYVRGRLNQLITRKEVPAQVTGKGSLLWFHLTDKELTDFRSFVNSSPPQSVFNQFTHEMLGHGIVYAGRGLSCLSTVMGQEELDTYVDAVEASLENVRF